MRLARPVSGGLAGTLPASHAQPAGTPGSRAFRGAQSGNSLSLVARHR